MMAPPGRFKAILAKLGKYFGSLKVQWYSFECFGEVREQDKSSFAVKTHH